MNTETYHNRKSKWLAVYIGTFLTLVLTTAMLLFQQSKLNLGMPVLVLPFLLVFISIVFLKPRFGLFALFFANYFAIGISRYIPGPLGLTVDCLLILTWLSVIFSQFNKKVEWKKLKNFLPLLALIWFMYGVFQLFNPESVSKVAWFYAMRGVSMYMVLTVPLVLLLFDKKIYLNKFIQLWAIFTLAGMAKGVMQQIVGPDPWEQYWLDTVGGKTHILPQGLRIFSFFTDSSSYGGSMGFSGVVFTILALHSPNIKKKLYYAFVALAAFYAMVISGTRGALAVPVAGFFLYALLSKKLKLVLVGTFILISSFSFLKYTTIGNSKYELRRIRSALDSDNPSLVVRKDNQKRLKSYLASRPFGGGIGSAGNWGLRFSPGTFLAETPPDGWYVQIWAEQGKVGLSLHLIIVFSVLFYASFIILFKLKSKDARTKALALISGIFGVMVASYSSNAFGQMPNGIIIYMSMAFIVLLHKWDKQEQIEQI